MKNNPILLLILVILAIGLFYYNNSKPVGLVKKKPFSVVENKQEEEGFIIVKNEFIPIQKEISGIICKPVEKVIKSKINGKIDFIRKGSFKSGDLLFRLENKYLFKSLADNKIELKNRLNSFILDLSSENKAKWKSYLETLFPAKVLTPFPSDFSTEEKTLLQKHNCLSLYNKLVDQENEMESYFILAKKSGYLKTVKVKVGDQIYPSDTLALAADNTPILVKSVISKKAIPEIKSFIKVTYLYEKSSVGKGDFFYFQKNYLRDSSIIYHSFLPEDNFKYKYGDTITISLSKTLTSPCFKLPKELLRVDSSIILINDYKKKVKVLKSEKDFHFVSGLDEGDTLKINR